MKALMTLWIIMETVFGVILPKLNISSVRPKASECGIDNSPISVVYEGFGKIETYPWLGTLLYPLGDKLLSTIVVLVSKQIVVGPAMDIDKVPKIDFRARSRVVLGTNCSSPAFFRVKSYSFHPDFAKVTLSALAIIQLAFHPRLAGFRPICAPPLTLNNAQTYTTTLSNDCHKSRITMYKMAYVNAHQCQDFYFRSGLDTDSIWPSHVICARATSGKECIWRSGTILAMKQNNQWSLVGIGVMGPGCKSPSRFIDYSVYHSWVRNSLLRMGRTAITKIADNNIILRRSLSTVQRFGPCDPEETKAELYTDKTAIDQYPHKSLSGNKHRISYNVDFYLEIFFMEAIVYSVKVYGKELKFLDIKRTMAYFNEKKKSPNIPILTPPTERTKET